MDKMNEAAAVLLLTVSLAGCTPADPATSSALPASIRAPAWSNSSDTIGDKITDCGIYEWKNNSEMPDETAIRSFLGLCQKDMPARVRIVCYTVEGDPIAYDVSFDGSAYTCTVDTTADRFGAQGISTRTWNYLIEQEFIQSVYDDGLPRGFRRTWMLSNVTIEEIEAHPLAEYEGLPIFEETGQYR